MNAASSELGKYFWPRCVWLSTLGWFTGFLFGFVAASSLEGIIEEGALLGIVAYCVLGAVLGAVLGLMQRRLLWSFHFITYRWVWSSAAGLAVAGGAGYGAAGLMFGFSEGLEELGSVAAIVGWTLVAAIGGALAGVFQWRALRPHVPRAGWWVVACTMGWALSIAANSTVNVVGFRVMADNWLAYSGAWFLGGLVAGGIVMGAVTGAAFVWLLKQPTK